MVTAMLAGLALAQANPIVVHCVSDISHEFTFYMDGRFHRQYLEGVGADARNWGSLHKLDLDNVNLLVIAAGETRVPFSAKTVAHLERYVREGGTLALLGNKGAGDLPLQTVATPFGASFENIAAQTPLKTASGFGADPIAFTGGGTLTLQGNWKPLIEDAAGKPVLARRDVGRGHVLVGIRGLFGQRPDASDPINAAWVRPLLVGLASTKRIDPSRPPQGQFAELSRQVGPLTLEYHEGTERLADDIAKEYAVVRPLLVEITGVEPAPGMITRMLMLPTGGGGFSSGERIAIGAWWGDYPTHRYPMIELIGHEAGHSWVLPYPEPVWNEPIATYLGIQVGKRLGLPEAQQTLERAIANARKEDPEMNKVDIGAPGAPNAVVWGKTYYVFEELERKYGPGVLADYFRTKRAILKPGRKGYSLDDCVAVWSRAVGEDLFPWFRSLGISVEASKTDIPIKGQSRSR